MYRYDNMNYFHIVTVKLCFMPVNEEFKRLIDKIKYEFSINQAQISERLGVKSTYLSDMINGRVPYNESMQKKIHEVFHIGYEDSSSIQEGVNNMRITSEIISSILDREGLKAATFAKSVGVVPTQIYDLQKGKIKKISEEIADKIISVYPHYNKVWLLTGEGDMLTSDVPPARSVDIPEEIGDGFNPRELLDIIHDLTAQGKQNAEANERNSRNIEKLIALLAESLKQERDERSGNRQGEKDSA